ncbi:MAG: hypothetical protein ACLFQX_12850 [Candidatus Kapaibacterium sp.]
MFKKITLLIAAVIFGLAIYSCSDDDDNPAGPSGIDLRGYWKGERTVGSTEYSLELQMSQTGLKLGGQGTAKVVTRTTHEEHRVEYQGPIHGLLSDTLVNFTIEHVDSVPVVGFDGRVIEGDTLRMLGRIFIDTVDYQIELIRD